VCARCCPPLRRLLAGRIHPGQHTPLFCLWSTQQCPSSLYLATRIPETCFRLRCQLASKKLCRASTLESASDTAALGGCENLGRNLAPRRHDMPCKQNKARRSNARASRHHMTLRHLFGHANSSFIQTPPTRSSWRLEVMYEHLEFLLRGVCLFPEAGWDMSLPVQSSESTTQNIAVAVDREGPG
jgi:hypothetical protein